MYYILGILYYVFEVAWLGIVLEDKYCTKHFGIFHLPINKLSSLMQSCHIPEDEKD